MADENLGGTHSAHIAGRVFTICTERLIDERTGRFTGEWHAWCFFRYDRTCDAFPADDVPVGITTQQSIAGGTGASEGEAIHVVEGKLRRVIATRNLDGTGFYSPPGGFVYPQGLPPEER